MSCGSCPLKRTNPLMQQQLVKGDGHKPWWFKIKTPPPNERFSKIKKLAGELGLATVCQEALCPNIGECWSGGTATFMVMGDTCTRACKFCNVNHGKPRELDPDEPQKLASAIAKLELDYAVITCVDRDDLPDGGAGHLAACIHELRRAVPKLLVEVLSSDFQGNANDMQKVIDADPHVLAHNIETVERLTPSVRDRRAGYKQSLQVLRTIKEKTGGKMYTKSSIMVGLGEKPEEVEAAMRDLRAVNVDFLTIGQYLRPTAWNLKVIEYVRPEQFEEYKRLGLELGFKYVASGPFIRSSYKAGELYIKSMVNY